MLENTLELLKERYEFTKWLVNEFENNPKTNILLSQYTDFKNMFDTCRQGIQTIDSINQNKRLVTELEKEFFKIKVANIVTNMWNMNEVSIQTYKQLENKERLIDCEDFKATCRKIREEILNLK